MSQADVLLAPEALAACELRKSPLPLDTSDINGAAGPPAGQQENDDDKHTTKACNGGSTGAMALKKKHCRKKKRKWRPYSKLSWEERDAKKAEKFRADMCACGISMAPYNTTQFLMEDHNTKEPDYARIPVGHRHRENSNSQDSSDDYYSSPEDEEDFMQQQFTETYKTCYAERLSSMSKGELVQELMSMEDRVETLQKRLDSVQRERSECQMQQGECDLEQLEKIRVFQNEIENLAKENERLRKENVDLRNQLCATKT